MNKAFLLAIGCFILFYGIVWTFNHVNPWLSIALAVGSGILLINYILKQLK